MGSVIVMRWAGALGESSILRMACVVVVSCVVRGWDGKRDAVWPSGPMPSRIRSRIGMPVLSSTSVIVCAQATGGEAWRGGVVVVVVVCGVRRRHRQRGVA